MLCLWVLGHFLIWKVRLLTEVSLRLAGLTLWLLVHNSCSMCTHSPRGKNTEGRKITKEG